MNMKNYEDFKSSVVERIADYCDRIGKHATVRLFEDGLIAQDEETGVLIKNTNRKYGHINAERLVGDYVIVALDPEKGDGYQCRFAVKLLFEMYLKDGWEAIEQVDSIDESVFKQIEHYDQIHDRLLICMRNAKNNDVERRGMVYRRIEDMAMTLYVIIKDDGQGNRLIAPVLRPFAEKWGITDDEVFAAALDNTARLSPPRVFYGIDDMLGINKNGCDFMSLLTPQRKVPMNPFSSTVSAIPSSDGATAIFYPRVCERLAELADGDYFVVFSGKDEAHVHRTDGISCETLKTLLARMNLEYRDTMLTQHVYRYDSAKKVLKKAL